MERGGAQGDQEKNRRRAASKPLKLNGRRLKRGDKLLPHRPAPNRNAPVAYYGKSGQTLCAVQATEKAILPS